MASLNELIAAGDLCCSIRAKTMFYEAEEHAEERDPWLENARTFGQLWCVHTQSVLGPDGQPVDVDTCRPGRGCCKTA